MKNFIRELLYPARCLGCDCVLSTFRLDFGFCGECFSKIKFADEPVCKKCGKVLRDDTVELCQDCKKKKRAFDQGRGIYLYAGPMKQSMYRFKYGNRRSYARKYAEDAEKLWGDYLKSKGIEAIVPVPMYSRKRRKRGYNQAEVFAKALAKRFDIPVKKRIVCRVRNTIPMKGLKSSARVANLKSAFKINESDVRLNCVLIVDDIFTTGATTDAVAKALRSAGVNHIYCLYVCVGSGD